MTHLISTFLLAFDAPPRLFIAVLIRLRLLSLSNCFRYCFLDAMTYYVPFTIILTVRIPIGHGIQMECYRTHLIRAYVYI